METGCIIIKVNLIHVSLQFVDVTARWHPSITVSCDIFPFWWPPRWANTIAGYNYRVTATSRCMINEQTPRGHFNRHTGNYLLGEITGQLSKSKVDQSGTFSVCMKLNVTNEYKLYNDTTIRAPRRMHIIRDLLWFCKVDLLFYLPVIRDEWTTRSNLKLMV